MITELREMLRVDPFVPFSIVTSAGAHYRIASPEHLVFTRKGTRAIVLFDDDSFTLVSPLHMTGIEVESGAAASEMTA